MTDIVNEDTTEEIREALLELLDEKFGKGVVRDEHLPAIFDSLDEIIGVASESALERKWKELGVGRVVDPMDLPKNQDESVGYTRVFWDSVPGCPPTEATVGRSYRNGQPTKSYVRDERSNVVFGPFDLDGEATMMAQRLRDGWSSYCLSDVASARVIGDKYMIGSRTVLDFGVSTDVMSDGTCVRTVYFLSSKAVLPDDTLVLVENAEVRRGVA